MLNILRKDLVHITLNNSVGNNWIFLLRVVVKLTLSRSSVNEDA